MPLQPGHKPASATPATHFVPVAPIAPVGSIVTTKPHPTDPNKLIVCDGESCTIIRKPADPSPAPAASPSEAKLASDTSAAPSADSKSALAILEPQTNLAASKDVVGLKDVKSAADGVGGGGGGLLPEPLLEDEKNRYILFPIKHWPLFTMYKKALASFWTVEEVDLGQDMKDWETLTPNEQYFIKNVLAFFASSDLLVMDNLAGRFMNDVSIAEAKCFYSAQIMQESIHSEMYGILLDTYVKDTAEKAKLFNAVVTLPAIKAKAEWALKWMDSDRPFSERLLAFACVEGIGFSGSFCSLFWLKKRGKMPGLTFSNELISRDESLHTEFATLLFTMLQNRPAQKIVEEIVMSSVEAEKCYVCESLPVALIGMNSQSMSQYIEFVADRLLDALGYDKVYNVANPFDWMEMLSLQGKSNFFEKRVGEYQRANVMAAYTKRMNAALGIKTDPSQNPTPAPTPASTNNAEQTASNTSTNETSNASNTSAAAAPEEPAAFISDLDC